MIKKYYEFTGYVWTWDTETSKWSKAQKNCEPEKILDRDWEDLTWHGILFDMYKRFRLMIGWNDFISCHDEDDQRYFQMLDKLTGR